MNVTLEKQSPFFAGLLLKDVLAKEMEDYVSGYYYTDGLSYVSPSSYYSDPTRLSQVYTNDIEDIGNIDYYSESSHDTVRVKPKHYIVEDSPKSDLETAAAAIDVTLSNVGDLGLSFLGTLLGLFTTTFDETIPKSEETVVPKLDFVHFDSTEDTTMQKGNFLRSMTATPTPYYTTGRPMVSTTQYQDIVPSYSAHPLSTPAPTFYQDTATTQKVFINSFVPNISAVHYSLYC